MQTGPGEDDAVRRRLAEVFGDALPERTRDELDDEPAGRSDEELLADRPPHHDR